MRVGCWLQFPQHSVRVDCECHRPQTDFLIVPGLFKSTDNLPMATGRFNRNDICVKGFDGIDDIGKVRVAHMGMNLSVVLHAGRGDLK